MSQKKLHIRPISFRAANAFVKELHRHHKPVAGCKFCIAVHDTDGVLHGVAMVGRPVARHYDNGFVAEVNRTCTDGTANSNSALYGAAWRVAREMGYQSLITYTQEGESGVSLHAAGWIKVKNLEARGSWAESSKKLKEMRDPVGSGGVARILWRIGALLPGERK